MTKYRKKTLVDAVPTFPDENGYAAWNKDFAPDWLVWAQKNAVIYKDGKARTMKIHVPEGELILKPGAWIIRGANGNIWPLDHEAFLISYEKVED